MAELDAVVRQDITNIFPGHPPKPMGHTNPPEGDEVLPSDLESVPCQWTEKWDEHRCVLFNGLCFNRVGDLYTKLPDTYTYKVAKYLEKCFKIHEYFEFDVGFMSHGPMKGVCFLYDIPQHKGTFRERDAIMRACNESFATTIIGDSDLNGQVVIPVSAEDVGMSANEFYIRCKNLNHDQLEGVVGKPWDHVYEWSRTEAQAKKQGWLKCRHK
jgi:ATP-dependent DNA ligase